MNEPTYDSSSSLRTGWLGASGLNAGSRSCACVFMWCAHSVLQPSGLSRCSRVCANGTESSLGTIEKRFSACNHSIPHTCQIIGVCPNSIIASFSPS
jgi:hypothetical protein